MIGWPASLDMVIDARNGSLVKFSFDDVALFMVFMFHENIISSGSFR